MSSLFFRSLSTFSPKRENSIKEALINTLTDNVLDVEYEIKDNNCNVLEISEVTNSLCVTIEAIFLHGLKDSLLWHTINFITGTSDELNRRPEPSFWSPLMVFLHSQVIEEIQILPLIDGEIGQCRAWIRMSLNEGVLSSYMHNMRKNCSLLGSYYKKYAFLRDRNCLEMIAKVLEKLETSTTNVRFKLPINSSFLNHWPDMSLQLSGLWTPSLKAQPINSGVDIAGSLEVYQSPPLPTPQPVRTDEPFVDFISNSPFRRTANFGNQASQRESLDLFLKKVDAMEVIPEKHSEDIKLNIDEKKVDSESNQEDSIDPSSAFTCLNINHGVGVGNSLSSLMQTSWSGIDQQLPDSSLEIIHRPPFERTESQMSTVSSHYGDRSSYDTLLQRHINKRNRGSGDDIFDMHNDSTHLCSRVISSGDGGMSCGGNLCDSSDHSSMTIRLDDFEIIKLTDIDSSRFNGNEFEELLRQMYRLAREPGLDGQGFICPSCQRPLCYNNFKVCAFSGNYFCDACMESEPALIPAKIIYNWDFGKYVISKRAAVFLDEVRQKPLLDLMLLNPSIYNASETMADLQSLRIRLNFVRAYLQTCTSHFIDGSAAGRLHAASKPLHQQFNGREYLFDQIHQYAVGDFVLIQRGTLQQQLQKAYKAGEKHILSCTLCSMKGFICEKCQSRRVLYPFHIDTTYRCKTCGAVFHADCLNERQPCPRCQRRNRRSEEVNETEKPNIMPEVEIDATSVDPIAADVITPTTVT